MRERCKEIHKKVWDIIDEIVLALEISFDFFIDGLSNFLLENFFTKEEFELIRIYRELSIKKQRA